MKWTFLFILSSVCIIAAICAYHNFHYSYGQISSSTKQVQPAKAVDPFRVGITTFGVTKETGNIFLLVTVNNATTGKYSNVSKEDLNDRDGVVDFVLSIPNQTITTGANFTACQVILKDASMSCKSGLNIKGRPGIIQFVLPTFKEKTK